MQSPGSLSQATPVLASHISNVEVGAENMLRVIDCVKSVGGLSLPGLLFSITLAVIFCIESQENLLLLVCPYRYYIHYR